MNPQSVLTLNERNIKVLSVLFEFTQLESLLSDPLQKLSHLYTCVVTNEVAVYLRREFIRSLLVFLILIVVVVVLIDLSR